MDEPVDPWGGVLPPDGLSLVVDCQTGIDGTRTHPVTITPAWGLASPHDLAAERIAVALGGLCSCVDLADRTLPAAQGYVSHRLRSEPAHMVHRLDGSWRPRTDVVGCCRDQGFPQARDAAAHLRRPQHWAQRCGAPVDAVRQLAGSVLAALAARLAAPELVELSGDLSMPTPTSPDAGWKADELLAEASGWRVLWDAGLHPVLAARLAAPAGGGQPARAVLEAAYAESVPQGTRRGGGRNRQAGERQRWAAVGVRPATITALLGADAYSVGDARVLAARLGRSVAEAADVLAAWQAAGLTPSVDTLVGVYWGPMLIPVPPTAAQVESTVEAARLARLEVSRLSAALALIRAGSPAAAAAYLADPIRRPDDPYSP